MDKRIYLSPPHMSGQEIKYIQEAFDTNWIAPIGPNISAFESEICEYTNMRYGLATISGTAGIHLALKYLGVGPGDYVFCSSLTFIGTCNPIVYQLAIPVFIDSEPESWNMSPLALEKAFEWARKNKCMPKAVIIVDLYGQGADYENLLPICSRYGVPVIEDAAEALGASYMNKMCGSFGEVGVFSFNGNKIITTSGGGMIVSNNSTLIEKSRFWSTQARENASYYEHNEIGYNYRISNVCAGIGRGQLQVLEERIQSKKKIRIMYEEHLKDSAIQFIPNNNKGKSNYWLTVITIDEATKINPDQIISALEEENIESRHIWKPMHMQPVFKDSNSFMHYDSQSLSEKLFKRGLCLPSGSALSEDDQNKVIHIINKLVCR